MTRYWLGIQDRRRTRPTRTPTSLALTKASLIARLPARAVRASLEASMKSTQEVWELVEGRGGKRGGGAEIVPPNCLAQMGDGQRVEFAGEIFFDRVDENLIVGRGFGEQCQRRTEFHGVDFAENVFSGTSIDSIYQLSAFDQPWAQHW